MTAGVSAGEANLHNKAVVRVVKSPIKTYTWDKPSRYPILFHGGYRSIYPYTMEDRLLHRVEDRLYTHIVLENEFIRVVILPELGGHLWEAYDKVSGKELFYNNQVVKPGLIALRGAWCATGIEWNFPVGHSVSTVSTVDHLCFENEDGSVTAVVGDLDRTTRMKWTVKITVHPGRLGFSLETVLSNPQAYPSRYMYWENAAIHATEGFQFVAPAKAAWTWGGKCQFPIVDGVDKSWYLAHPRSIDYFMLGLGENYYGYFDHKRKVGAVHVADYHVMPGKKFFTWGTAEHALSWQRNLTDDDGPYIELQSGLTPTQAAFDFFKPESAIRWDEAWFSIGDLGYFVFANREAALHLSNRLDKRPYPDEVEVAVVTVEPLHGASVKVASSGKPLMTKHGVDLKPGVAGRWKVALPKGARELSVVVTKNGATVLDYSTKRWRNIKELPYKNPRELWKVESGSAETLVDAAVGMMKWFDYRKSLNLINKALKQRPGFTEGRYWKGNLFYNLMRYDEAIEELSRVTARSDKYAMAQWLTGQANRIAGSMERAKECASRLLAAAKSRPLGHHLAGEIALSRGDYEKAADQLGRVAGENYAAPHTIALYATALRRAGKKDLALAAARVALKIDPLEFLALNEMALLGEDAGRDSLMRGMVESFLELASYYEDVNLFDDAAAVLEHYRTKLCGDGCSPMVYYHLGWVNEMLGRRSEAAAFYAKAAAGKPDYVFPFRSEDFRALEAALRHNGDDALAHYLVGLILAYRIREDEALKHWTKALKGLGEHPVLLRNMARYHLVISKKFRRAAEFYRRAIAAAPADEELYAEADEVFAKAGSVRQRTGLLEAGMKTLPESQKVRRLVAQAYYFAGRYDDAIDVLMVKEFDHWEGEHLAYQTYVRSYLEKGKIALRKKELKGALSYFAKAMEYPANLKVGRPAYPRHAPQLYLSGIAYEALGEVDKARSLWKEGGEERHEGWEGSISEEGYYKGLCLARLGRKREARALWRTMTRGLSWPGFPAGYEDFVVGLGCQGLEQWDKAIRRLERSLDADHTNSKVKYHLAQARKHRQAGL